MNNLENVEANLVPYDQAEVETLLKQLMFNNGITDVLYEGSNISQIASVISYAISTLNINTAINLQETILPLASKRMNVLFGARQLGYEPRHITSYKYRVRIVPKYNQTKVFPVGHPEAGELNINDITPFNLVVSTDQRFINNGIDYIYRGPTFTIKDITNKAITNAIRDDFYPDNLFPYITIIQGILTQPGDDPELNLQAIDYIENGVSKTKQDYLIPYNDVEDHEGITTYLTYIDYDGSTVNREKWVRSKEILIDENLAYNKNKFIRMENIILGYPAIFFEYAGIGNGVRSQTLIEIEVLQSMGSDGKATRKFEVVNVNTNNPSRASELFEIHEEYMLEQNGLSEETDTEIKENAIVFNNTGNRAVTRLDYIALTKKSNFVTEADAWGGEEEKFKQKGEIWISCTPSNQTKPVLDVKTTSSHKFIVKIGNLSTNPLDDQGLLKNYRNWYLTDIEWAGVTNTNTLGRSYHEDGLRDYLDSYKIMTMGLNLRQPLYIDFSFDAKIVKYDIQTNPEETNTVVFDIMNKYFNTIENFGSEFINSNFQRIVDQSLGTKSGINYQVTTKGVLHEKMIDDFYSNLPAADSAHGDFIIVNLAFPFDNILPNGAGGGLALDLIPRIDTPNFGKLGSTLNLTVDYTALSVATGAYREVPIKLGNSIIGSYRVDIDKANIELRFNITNKETFFGPEQTSTNGDVFRDYTRFNIEYPPFNSNIVDIPFHRNVIPRLSDVTFNY